MSDLISRQAAIDAMEESKRIYVDRRVIIGKMQDIVSNLPSAQPRKGKWAGKGDSEGFGIFICDNCGKFSMMEYDFCPNCGSYNGGKNEA